MPESTPEVVYPRPKRGRKVKEAEAPPLSKQLWNAAVALRGTIEPGDYKRYVLPLIFLRFLSLRYEKRRTQLELLIREPRSEYYGDTTAVDDPDEYRSVGAFVLPEQARWDNLVRVAREPDIKTRLDDTLELLERTYPERLRGLLPRIYAGSNLEPESLRGLINLFSKDLFAHEKAEDVIGQVYEYFIGEFASSEGKRGGEYFTPASIVRVLVGMLEPDQGVVYDPCCGSGGMFVQSDLFTRHNHQLSFVGQESKDFTLRLCRMNLFIHGLDGNIKLGNTYTDDQHPGLKADYILANPPFNDGSKGEHGWGATRIPSNDPRLSVGGRRMPLAPRNANPMWMMHFLHHLREGGTAGFVMATGELSNNENSRLEVRRALVDGGYVDCVVQLSGQLFANTQIPCALWFLSKNREGTHGFRRRQGEILFVDGRKLGSLIPGSRKQKELADEEIERIAAVYREFRRTGTSAEVPGFCRVATVDEVREHRYALTPGRYVGAEDNEEDDEPFEEKMPRLIVQLEEQFAESGRLQSRILDALSSVTG